MNSTKLASQQRAAWLPLLCIPILALTTGCESKLTREAREAEEDGRVISNEMMSQMYPKSFRPGTPQYLERDFEAGADFICDEIRIKYDRDICKESEIKWRH